MNGKIKTEIGMIAYKHNSLISTVAFKVINKY